VRLSQTKSFSKHRPAPRLPPYRRVTAKTKIARRDRKWILYGLCAAIFLTISGCAVGPDFVRPPPPPVDHYTHGTEPSATVAAEGRAQRFEAGAHVPADWWRLFNSPKLDAAIQGAIADNLSLQAAQANLRQSQDILQAGYGVFYPQIDANLGGTRQRYSPARVGQNLPSSLFNLFTLSTTVSYALDVWGGERRTVESLRAQVDFQRYSVLATYLTLTGNIANTVIAHAGYQAEIEATEEIIKLQREQVSITDAQVQAGTVPYSNLLSLESQLAAYEATLPALRQKLSQTEHLLAVLSGRAPAEWDMPAVTLADITLPTNLPRTLPSMLVRQRPDILAAEAQLHASSANIGVATAALFPSFGLNGTYGVNSNSTGNLFKSNSRFWSVGADITAPLFHGGSLSSQRRAAIEANRQFLATYRLTVLTAFAQVADSLRALEHDAETVEAQSRSLRAADEALKLVQANYAAGVASYLQVLVANGQYYQAKIGYLQGVAQRYQDTVALYVALGGGWWNAESNTMGNLVPASRPSASEVEGR
jgi:NodT family efflux transporter outer membrane factor (OMF) lipoprotein